VDEIPGAGESGAAGHGYGGPAYEVGFTTAVQAGAYEATPSAVDGRAVQKVLPYESGSGKRSKMRA
jgi:hypothetical protein